MTEISYLNDGNTFDRVVRKSMNVDPTAERLVKEIGLRTFADRYFDRDEEREVLAIASQLGMDSGPAAAVISQFCIEKNVIREATVRDAIRAGISRVDGKIDRDQFDVISAKTKETVGTVLTDREIKKLTVSVMEEMGRANVKRGWFSNWYVTVKRELGVV